MKILLASSSFHGGGITSYALELINSYSKNNEFYLMTEDTNGFINETSFSNIIFENMTDLSVENAKRVMNVINKLNPEILLISFAHIVGLIVPFLKNDIHVISVSHSLRYDESDLAAFQAPYIDAIVALSHYNKVYLQNKFNIKNEEKIQVVYNFIKPSFDIPSINEKKATTREPTIVFAGGGAPSKSPDLIYEILLKLLKTPAKFRFYWLGNTTPPLKKIQKLKDIGQIVPNDSRVIFTGKIPRNKAASILGHANIILTPSRREGCPMALIEAMSSGVIVLTSDYKNGCREIVEEAKCGKVISHKKVDDFVLCILDIINNPSKYLYFYDAATHYYEWQFSFEAWKKEMDGLIQNTDTHHLKRKSFSEVEYLNIRSRWKRISIINGIHMLFFETLPSALFFFIRNLTFKRYEHKKNY